MTLYYRYRRYTKPQPIVSLDGRTERPKPVIAVALLSGQKSTA